MAHKKSYIRRSSFEKSSQNSIIQIPNFQFNETYTTFMSHRAQEEDWEGNEPMKEVNLLARKLKWLR